MKNYDLYVIIFVHTLLSVLNLHIKDLPKKFRGKVYCRITLIYQYEFTSSTKID